MAEFCGNLLLFWNNIVENSREKENIRLSFAKRIPPYSGTFRVPKVAAGCWGYGNVQSGINHCSYIKGRFDPHGITGTRKWSSTVIGAHALVYFEYSVAYLARAQ